MKSRDQQNKGTSPARPALILCRAMETPTPLEIADGEHLPPIAQDNVLSTSSLIETMGLAKKNEKSLSHLINTMHSDVVKALHEVSAITTHDTNLERQYNEVVAENVKLNFALNRARREITTLKGKLTLLEMVPSEIREENKRNKLQLKKIIKQENNLQAQRIKNMHVLDCIEVPSFQERSQTVNHFGEYIDYNSKRSKQIRRRRLTHPMRCAPATSIKSVPLPPSMIGCSCSVCNTQQSLGTFTFGKNQTMATSFTNNRSSQQILLGDRVIIRGQKLGTVKYIGKLNFDYIERLFIGIHLDSPIGISDGEIKGTRYFSCPPSHGVFVLPHDIISVIGRKTRSSGTSIPRIRKELLVAKTLHSIPSSVPQTSECMTPPISESTPTSIERANEILEREMKQLFSEQKSPSDLVNPSVAEMSRRMKQLQKLNRPQQMTIPHTEDTDHDQPILTEQQQQPDKSIDIAMVYDNVLAELQAKDLGNTGYVTITELSTTLEKIVHLSKEQVNTVIVKLGLETNEGYGIEYNNIIQRLAETIVDCIN